VDAPESAREAAARARAEQRLRRQRDTLRPLGLVVLAAVAIGAFNGQPAPAMHGEGLAVAAALAVFGASLMFVVRGRFIERPVSVQIAAIAAMGAAGAALVALQPHGATELGAGAAVWMAVTRLPSVPGAAVAGATTVAVALAEARTGGSAAVVLAATVLCGLLALVAHFLRQSRASEATTELLLAQLEDARDEQVRAAAVNERGRIARELHDVLAHSLSGAAIQLQAARRLAEREQAGADVRAAIERAAELVRDGLVSARQAVGALRGDDVPGVAHLDALVTSFRTDIASDISFAIEGSARQLPPEAGLALYRGAQEALTNVARHAPGATTTVILRYDTGVTALTVEDWRAEASSTAAGLGDVGGGNGLDGMRERVERAGGRVHAGPTEHGWRVELEVPA
jgi:signal transduction histidine kinase